MRFENPSVFIYGWRLVDVSSDENRRKPPIGNGRVRRPRKGGTEATVQVKPVKKNTEFVLQIYAIIEVSADRE